MGEQRQTRSLVPPGPAWRCCMACKAGSLSPRALSRALTLSSQGMRKCHS